MDGTSGEDERGGTVRDTYMSEQDRSLTDAVLDAIETHRGEDISSSDFVLYEDVNPDALDKLFKHDARPRTRVTFDTDDVRVELYGDHGVEIVVRDRPSE